MKINLSLNVNSSVVYNIFKDLNPHKHFLFLSMQYGESLLICPFISMQHVESLLNLSIHSVCVCQLHAIQRESLFNLSIHIHAACGKFAKLVQSGHSFCVCVKLHAVREGENLNFVQSVHSFPCSM